MFKFISCRLRTVVFLVLCLFAGSAWAINTPTDCIAITTSATGGIATIEMAWTDNSTDETRFDIYYSNGGGFVFLGSAGANVNSVSFTLPAGVTYQFVVFGYNEYTFAASGFSNTATVSTFDLNAPFNFSVAVVDPFNVSMKWEEASYAELGFAIERRVGTTGSWQYLGSLGANGIRLGATNLIEPLGTYQFRVRAWKGTAPMTPDSTGVNVSPYTAPFTVTSPAYTMTATPVSGQPTINLAWPNIVNEAGYYVYYKQASDSDYSLLATKAANVITHQVTSPTIVAGGSYNFAVLPFQVDNNNSPYTLGESNIVTVTADGITSRGYAPITKGVPFSYTITSTAIGTTLTNYTVTGLPPGLALSGSVISGTPTTHGVYVCPITAHFANSVNLTKNLTLRVLTLPAPPTVGTLLTDWTTLAGQSRDTNLAGTFLDEDSDSGVRITTSVGVMDWILYDSLTPLTITNLMTYINAGDYNGTFIHRSIPGFVIQGGGYKPTGNPNNYTSITRRASPANEPGISNLAGTLSMAKSAGNENSATSEFFVSLGDNASNLDNQNGGFTVFGRIAGTGMATVVNPLAALPTGYYAATVDSVSNSGLLSDCPINDVTAPGTMDQSKLVTILSTTPLPKLTYSIQSNSNPTSVSAQVASGHLILNSLAGGSATIVVQATDLDGNNTTQTIQASVTDTFATWSGHQSFVGGQETATSNPDGDSLNNLQEYAFMGAPNVANPAEPPVAGLTTAPNSFMTLSFPVRKFTQGLTYTVQAASNLAGPWSTVWTSASGFTDPQILTATDVADRTNVVVKDTIAVTPGSRRFLRVKTEQQ